MLITTPKAFKERGNEERKWERSIRFPTNYGSEKRLSCSTENVLVQLERKKRIYYTAIWHF